MVIGIHLTLLESCEEDSFMVKSLQVGSGSKVEIRADMMDKSDIASLLTERCIGAATTQNANLARLHFSDHHVSVDGYIYHLVRLYRCRQANADKALTAPTAELPSIAIVDQSSQFDFSRTKSMKGQRKKWSFYSCVVRLHNGTFFPGMENSPLADSYSQFALVFTYESSLRTVALCQRY